MCICLSAAPNESGKTVALYHFASFVMLNDVFALVEERRDRADEKRLAIFHSFVKIVLLWLLSCQLRKNTLCVNPLYVMETLWTMWKKNLGLLFKWKTLHSHISPLSSSAQCSVLWWNGRVEAEEWMCIVAVIRLKPYSPFCCFFPSVFWRVRYREEKRKSDSERMFWSTCLLYVVPHEFPATRSLPSHHHSELENGLLVVFALHRLFPPLAGITIPFSHSNSPQYLIVYFMGQWDFPLLGLFAPLSLLFSGSVKIKHGW